MKRATRSLALSGAMALVGATLPACAGDLSAFVSGAVDKPAASSTPSFDAAQEKADTIWAKLPLQIRRAMLVSEKAPVFGAYRPRPNALYRPNDTILAYIEPIGYEYQPVGDGTVKFGVSLDYEILLPDGTILAGQKNVMVLDATSHARAKELMVNASMHLGDDFPEGTYVLHYTLRDINTGKTAETSLPFQVARQA